MNIELFTQFKMKLAGIVTLYNPNDSVKGNILSYLDDLDVLYVVDNTKDNMYKNKLPKSDKIKYLFQNGNVGVARALNIGAQLAIENGYSWLLTMDQDSKFIKNDLFEMKKYIDQLKDKSIGLLTPWHVINTGIKKPLEMIDHPFEVMTSGNIINLAAYQKVGGYKDWYFIDDIDIEYCMNLNINGYKITRLNYIELKHDLGDIEVKHFLNRDFVCSNHNYIRRYYMVRNTFYLCDSYDKYFKDYCNFLKRGLRGQLQNIVLFEKDKFRKIASMYRGYRAYKMNISGSYDMDRRKK